MDALEWIHVKTTEIESLTVAFVLAVAQFVAGLQVSTLPEGFAILGVDYVAAVV